MLAFGIVITILATLLHLTVRGFAIDVPYAAGVFKMTASTGFLLAAFAAGAFRSRAGAAIFAGLAFSWFGDLFLIGEGPRYFILGLVSFFMGHLCYCASFVMRHSDLRIAAGGIALATIPGYFLSQWILPGVTEPGLKMPVIAYMSVISIMVALSAGCFKQPGGGWMFAGAALFYLSDIFVARSAFVSPGFINSLLGLPLYYGGQTVLAAGISLVDRRTLLSPNRDRTLETHNAPAPD